jgi:hypothetical protein
MESREPNLLNSLMGSSDPFECLLPRPGLDDTGPGLVLTGGGFIIGVDVSCGMLGVLPHNVGFPPTAPNDESSSTV